MPLPADVKTDIADLYADYGSSIDDDLERWPDFFIDDAYYRVVARENYDRGLPMSTLMCRGRGMLIDRVAAIRETMVYIPRHVRHLITDVRILEVGAQIRARANFAIYESPADASSHLLAVGRYYDEIDTQNGRLRFAEKICVYDGNLVAGSFVYPL